MISAAMDIHGQVFLVCVDVFSFLLSAYLRVDLLGP